MKTEFAYSIDSPMLNSNVSAMGVEFVEDQQDTPELTDSIVNYLIYSISLFLVWSEISSVWVDSFYQDNAV